MAFLGKEKLLTQAELEIKQVTFKNGDWVFVREMTGKERNAFENSIMKQEKDNNGVLQLVQKLDNFRSKLAVCTLCDEEGNLLFTMLDVERLSAAISATMLEEIVKVAQSMNAIVPEVKEEIVKN